LCGGVGSNAAHPFERWISRRAEPSAHPSCVKNLPLKGSATPSEAAIASHCRRTRRPVHADERSHDALSDAAIQGASTLTLCARRTRSAGDRSGAVAAPPRLPPAHEPTRAANSTARPLMVTRRYLPRHPLVPRHALLPVSQDHVAVYVTRRRVKPRRPADGGPGGDPRRGRVSG